MAGSCRQRRPILPAAARRRCRAAAGLALARYPQRPPANRPVPGGRADQPLEVLAGIIGGAVAASLGRGAPWQRLVQNRIRVAAVPPAEGNAMVGESFPEVGQGPVPQLDPVAGAQRLLADGLPVYPAGGPTAQIDVDVFVTLVAADLGMMCLESLQAHVGLRPASADCDPWHRVE